MVILYGHPESGHTYKVALTLALAGIPFDYRWVDVFRPREQRSADFQAASRSLPKLRHCLRFDESAASPTLLDWLRGRLQLDLQRLEQELSASQWLLSAGPSIVDVACFAYLFYDDIGLELGEFPRLRDWMMRMRALSRWRHPRELPGKPPQ